MSPELPNEPHSQVPSAPALALILAALAMIGPFSIDTYLPAFPNIQADLHTSAIEVQQTLTAYLLSFAVMTLWHGALADAFGRRTVVLGWLAVFMVASLGCAAAHTIHYLWAFRILQGVAAGAGVVVGRAIARDLYAGVEAERLLSLVTMIFAIGPAVAPIIGGWLVSLLDWRSIFLFMFAYSVLLFWFSWKKLPESLPPEKRHPLNAKSLIARYGSVLGSAKFHLFSGVVALNMGGLFLYVAASPVFVLQHLHLNAHQFGWQFVPSVSGIFLGALAANRMAGRMRPARQIWTGYVFMLGAAVFNLGYHLLFTAAVPWSIVPLFFFCFGMSVVAPSITLTVLDLFPHARGVAASCQSFVMTLLSSLISGVIAPLLAPSIVWLAAGQLGMVVLGLAAWKFATWGNSVSPPDSSVR